MFRPGWRADTAIFVTECPGCLHREEVNLKQVDSYDGRGINVNEVICIDLVGAITMSSNKRKYIFSILDQFSRFVAAVPLPDKSARSVENGIMTNWISLYGAPATIRMDQGKEFDNALLKTLLHALDVNIKVGFNHNNQFNPVERFHRILWALLKAKKANGENNWEKSLPTLILAYNATQHYFTNSSPARIFLGRELNIPHLSLLPKFVQNNTPSPHSVKEQLYYILDLMRASDDVRIRRQFRAYERLQDDVCVGDKVYCATLPPQSNSQKLQLSWSGPVMVSKIINNAMIEVTEYDVKNPQTYVAHRSKIRLAKKMGQKDVDPLFKLPRLPAEAVKDLAEELESRKFVVRF